MLGVHDFLVQARDTHKKSCNFDKQIRINILLHYAPALILRITGFFCKVFPAGVNPSKSLANRQKSNNKPKKKGQACNVSFLSNTRYITFCTGQNPQSYFLHQEQGNTDLRKQNNAATVKPSRFFVFSFHSPTLLQVKAYFLFQLLHCWNNTGQVIWKVSACGWISSHGRMANVCLLTAAS